MDLNLVWQRLVFLLITFLFTFAAKLLFDSVERHADDEICERSNLAIGLRRAGIYLAIPIGMLGAIRGVSQGFVSDLTYLLIDGLIVTLLLVLASFINDRIFVPGINNVAAVREGNTAVALVDFAGFVATGFIARGAFTGEGGGVASALVFFFLGQLALVLVVMLYEWVMPFHAIEEIRRGNNAAGMMVAGMMVAVGIILSNAIAGDFVGWGPGIAWFATTALIGIALQFALMFPIDWLFLRRTTLRTEIERDRNVAAVSVVTGVQIALAVMIAGVVV